MRTTRNTGKRPKRNAPPKIPAVTPAQEQAKAASVKDLLASVSGFMLPGMVNILEVVRKNLALIDLANTPEGEKTCVDEIGEPFRHWHTFGTAQVAIRSCVRELLNYRHEVREQVIVETIRVAKNLQQKAEELRVLVPAVHEACLAFDGRAQAFSQICAVLEEVCPITNIDFLAEATRPARTKGKSCLPALRNEPKLRKLMRAYDLATEIFRAW